jgi:hypothetical protein
MSDTQLGPSWWQASDGKWYAPDPHSGHSSREPTPLATPEEDEETNSSDTSWPQPVEVTRDFSGWEDYHLGKITTALLRAGIPNSWDGLVLSIPIEYDGQVDEIVDELLESWSSPSDSSSEPFAEMHDFEDGNGPVLAHRHPNGGGWVAETASAAKTAFVGPDASVFVFARLLDFATVADTAWVLGNAEVGGHARVTGDAEVNGFARVRGNADVAGNAFIADSAIVEGDAVVSGHARVLENAIVNGNARVVGNAEISADVVVSGGNRLPETPSPAWYPDPNDANFVRYWDGAQWTEQNRPSDPARDLRKTSSVAVTALVFAFLFWPVGIVLGHVARRSIRRSGDKGSGLAVAALIISYIWVALLILVIVATLGTSQPNGYNNLSTLQASVTQGVNANLRNPSNAGYSPGVSVSSTVCVHNSGTQYSCAVSLSDSDTESFSVTVSSDGTRWVSNG